MIIMGAGGCVRGGTEPAGESAHQKNSTGMQWIQMLYLNTQICSPAVSIQDN